MLKTKNLPV